MGEYGPDHGLSIDAALGLARVPGQEEAVRAIGAAVAADLDTYTTGAAMGTDDVYAGPVAKATVLAQAAGTDPADVGGTDLVAQLEELVTDDGPTAGRLADRLSDPGGTDYANALGQAYAVQALAVAESPEADPAAAYLAQQQCPDGWFRLYFPPADAADQGCGSDDPPDTDVTALAVAALDGVPGHEQVVDDAVSWLARTQGEDGGFAGAEGTEVENANSTGLAGQALLQVGYQEQAERAGRWLAARQLTDLGCEAGTTPETGAVAYDDAALAARDLAEPADRGQWLRATAQAVAVLAGTGEPAASVTAERTGDTVLVRGLDEGERGCVVGPGIAVPVEGAGSEVEVPVEGPGSDDLVLRRLAGDVPVPAAG
ncbi:prenyltransferase/squalene oxidase repeat-containing protein [Nocardioides pantholopis]|uniref:prenyltransferase/squalene oxidase repeat-containing protein n=1 Tax=Nocardioides pantholopis TaxID=2483798 RepID=UPI000FD866D5|nr:prenyltransferase/squalene oxidase repeat-containing protein [Nocardioides pantholopis]